MKTASALALLVAVLAVGSVAAQEYPTLAFIETFPELSNFTAVVEFSELYHVLDGEDGPYTIFAPNNDGFVKALTPFESSVTDFITGGEEEEEHSAAHLKYHVVKGTYKVADLYDGQILDSITDNGAGFTIRASRYNEGDFFVVGNNTYYERPNRGLIVDADLEVPGSENIVHIIDSFLFTEEE